MSDIKGKIVKIDLNNTGTKPDGSTFTNIKIRLEGIAELITISKSSPAGKFTEKLDLKAGDEITIVKGGQYNSVQKVMKGSGYTKSTNGPTGKSFTVNKGSYNSDGARHGMIVGKAVELAIARNELNLDALKQSAKDVIALTEFVEASGKTTPKSDVDPFKKTADTVKVTDDFANSDEDF